MMNPDILPPQYWKKEKYFHATNGDVFATYLISITITLQFFSGCSIAHKVIGSKLPGKDLIIGFDAYVKKTDMRILPIGLRYKHYFTSWEPIPNYFLTLPVPFLEERTRLRQNTCANSHADFLLKCNHPL